MLKKNPLIVPTICLKIFHEFGKASYIIIIRKENIYLKPNQPHAWSMEMGE